MKKIIFILFLNLFILSGIFANSDSFFTTEVSLGSGISIYDSSSDSLRKDLLSQKDYKRIILGFTADTNLNISDPLKIMLGAELFSDFLWNKNNHYNTLDYSFFSGIKVYPNRTGLNLSICYVLGNRNDFFTQTVEEKTEDKITGKAWGNGFRIAIQYDFMQDKNYKVKPNAGAYYRCVPRGNYNTDHILCLYGGIRF